MNGCPKCGTRTVTYRYDEGEAIVCVSVVCDWVDDYANEIEEYHDLVFEEQLAGGAA
jgi:predicted  nucleic acid-binding Zn-ribbon protein